MDGPPTPLTEGDVSEAGSSGHDRDDDALVEKSQLDTPGKWYC